jgi:hypothetical protein
MASGQILTELSRAVRHTWAGLNEKILERSYAFSNTLIRRARVFNEGNEIRFALWKERQPTTTYGSYDELPRVQREQVVEGTVKWKHYAVAIQIDGPSLRANLDVGIGNLLDMDSLRGLPTNKQLTLFGLVDRQMARAVEDLKFAIGADVYGIGTGQDGDRIEGLGTIIDTSLSYAGLAVGDVGTDDVSGGNRWAANVDSNSGTNRTIGLETIANMGADIRRGNESAEDIMVYMRNDVFATLQVLLQGQQRFESAALADIGFDNIVWDNMTFVRDEMAPANTMFFINHNHMYAALRNSANFEFLGFEKEDDSVVGHVIVDINLVCDDRHRQGKITDITTV